MKVKQAYFRLYACCIAVKGHRRSLICDVQRGDFFFIPNILCDLLTKFETHAILAVKKSKVINIYLHTF